MAADPVPTTLEAAPDALTLSSLPKDSLRVIVRALDQAGNLMPFLDDGVTIRVSGPAKRLGPETVTLKGGAVGFWLETLGGAGDIGVTVSSPRFATSALALKAI